MKKLLVLMLVLGMASFANASITLSVNGDVADDYIELTPSEFVTLDIFMGDVDFAGGAMDIVLSNPQGSLDYSGITFKMTPLTRMWVGSWQAFEVAWESPWLVNEQVSDAQRVMVMGMNFTNNTVGPYTLMDGLVFHCDEATDLIIDLFAYDDLWAWTYDAAGVKQAETVLLYEAGSLIDSIYVYQPEPMTIALLGLGGLFLRRRRK